jgi:hypothetical protein
MNRLIRQEQKNGGRIGIGAFLRENWMPPVEIRKFAEIFSVIMINYSGGDGLGHPNLVRFVLALIEKKRCDCSRILN